MLLRKDDYPSNLRKYVGIAQDEIMGVLRIYVAALPLIASAASIHAEDGIVWNTRGNWQLNHTEGTVHRGDAIAPGALLTAEDTTNASILALLPDGQRLLFECHDSRTCTQGFRVPALIAKPDDEAIELFDSVRAAMHQPAGGVSSLPASAATETEAVVRLQTDGTIPLRQLLAALPPGQYRMTVQGENDAQPSEQSLKWSGAQDEGRLFVPGTGVYRLRLFGDLGAERMRVVALVESAGMFSDRQKSFAAAKDCVQEWNETFPGWPTHEWLQLFLIALAHSPSDSTGS